jgi:hypothetical protein
VTDGKNYGNGIEVLFKNTSFFARYSLKVCIFALKMMRRVLSTDRQDERGIAKE